MVDIFQELWCANQIFNHTKLIFYQLFDLEPRVLNGVRNSEIGGLYGQQSFFYSPSGGGAGNNWASGYMQAQTYKVSNEICFFSSKTFKYFTGRYFRHDGS